MNFTSREIIFVCQFVKMDLIKVVVYKDSLETINSDFDIDSMEESGHLWRCNINIFREIELLCP